MKRAAPKRALCGAPNPFFGLSACKLRLGHVGNHAIQFGSNGWSNGELSERMITLERELSKKLHADLPSASPSPVPMILHCPMCRARHVDKGEFATKLHHTHACQTCGNCWRPAIVPTVGVQFLPGFKDKDT